ncbi:MAG TPA: WYL domain-containing protein [Acidimicrobiales bacterium]|nr:WYL domain-containing protein [Acidimicrobiales bacterium]
MPARLERLVNLTAALLDAGRPLTRDELRRRVGGYSDDPSAFRRNFERDKDLLRQMGMPVTTEPLDPDRPDVVGYRIRRDDYELPDPGLDDDELAALRLATSAVRLEGAGEALATALRKLAAAPPAGGGPTAELPVDERAATVFGAVAERRRIRFSYRGADRLVDPWRMSYRNGQWYLSGHDHGRADSRLYRLDRVEGPVEVVGEPGAFVRPDDAERGPAKPWQIGDDEAVVVDLLVDEPQARFAEEQLGADTVVERRAGGAVRFAVPATNLAALRTFVLGLLDHAEVLGPPQARADMVAWLSALAAPAVAGDRAQ